MRARLRIGTVRRLLSEPFQSALRAADVVREVMGIKLKFPAVNEDHAHRAWQASLDMHEQV